ncbi:MAG TPA: tyrosine-type recombinase/integrase, partial [Catalimonadaceae bacterium]|nr:tyrosine-type recombinase/integrase [Catalimonadaceae bacterium]
MVAFFLQYLRHQKRRSPHTVLAYESDLEQFSLFLKQEYEKEAFEAQKSDIRNWIVALTESGLGPSSINRKLSTLRTFFDFLLAENKISNHPLQAIRSLKKPKRLPIFIRENNMDQLLENLENSSDFSGLRDELILNLLYGTGIRLSELLSLTWDSIDLKTGQMKVTGKRNKERIIPVTQNLIQLIQKYRHHIETQLPDFFCSNLILTDKGKPAYPVLVERIVKKYLSMVTTEKKKSPHVLRHTYATHLLNAGA